MTTKTTLHLALARRDRFVAHVRAYLAQRDPLALLSLVIVAVVISLALGTSLWRTISAPAIAAAPTPGMVILIATQPAAIMPTAIPIAQVSAQLPAAPARYVVGFDAPNGTALGAIPEPAAGAIVARWGDDWLQTTWNGAPIWIRVVDLGMNLANIAPAPAAPAALQQPVVVEPQYQTANELERAAPTPEPVLQVLSERQQNIQQHYVEVPTLAPMQESEVTKEWARQQWRSEHPEAQGATP